MVRQAHHKVVCKQYFMEKTVPVIPIRDGIIFPSTDSVLTFGRPKSLVALESAFQRERIVVFVLQKNAKLNDPTPEDLYSIGTLCRIERMIRTDGEINAQVRGLSRVKILSYENHESYYLAKVEAKFHHPVLPGDRLKIEVETIKMLTKAGILKTQAFVEEKLVAEAEIGFGIRQV